MNEYKRIFKCRNELDTKRLAHCFSLIARKGDVFALFGTLGVGKSTFARYFIQSLTDASEVPSPTFTLVQSYDTAKFPIYHYDMYRLKYPEEAFELGVEESFFLGVNLIEWPEKIGYILPKNVWKIEIATNDNIRYFTVSVCEVEKYQRLESIAYD